VLGTIAIIAVVSHLQLKNLAKG